MIGFIAAVDVHASEHRLLIVLIQLCVIVAAARAAGIVARRMGQPAVVGEVVAGLMLGPSLFGHFFPGLSAQVFDPATKPVFETLKEIGLVFLLFIVGLELEISHLKSGGRTALGIGVAGIVIPFAMGWALAVWLYPQVAGALNVNGLPIDRLGFLLFMGTAMCITAMPVLGRILVELKIIRTRLGAITLTAAAVGDVIGWILLASVSAIVRAEFDPMKSVYMMLESLAFLGVILFVARPLLKRYLWTHIKDGELSLNGMALLCVVLFLCAIATSLIGIFAVFGAFLLGAAISDEHDFRQAVTSHLRQFVTVFFVPIFFTYSGLQTDIGSLQGAAMWAAAVIVIVVAVAGKFGACTLAARSGGFSWRESTCVGVMMNTRGLMELIVVNVGYQLGVLPKSVFCMLVLMAVVTTIMTTPALMLMMPGTELESHIRQSGFASSKPAAP